MTEYSYLPRKSQATEDGYKKASKQWDIFLTTKDLPEKWQPQMSEVESTLNEFATYLVTTAKKMDGDYFSLGSVLQYLSGAKEIIKKNNPTWSVWITHTGRNATGSFGWYDEIRYAVNKAIVKRVFESGEMLMESSLPIGRKLLQKIIHALWKCHDIDSLEAAPILVYNYATVGRAGEAAFSSWRTAFYDYDECAAVLYCPMPKVTSAKHITLYNDGEYYELDAYFHLSCYWIIGGGKHHISAFEEEEHWIFPSMALKSHPGKRLNERLRHGLSSIIRAPITYKTTSIGSGSTCFNGNYTLTSLRDGAITFLMNNDDLHGPMHAVNRSGHDHTNICSVFEYYWLSYTQQCQAGRALAGWSGKALKHGGVPFPDISVLGEDSLLHVHNFIIALYQPTFEGFNPGHQQWIIMERCFATFMLHYPDFERQVGFNHPVVERFRKVAMKMDIDSKKLRAWHDLLSEKWVMDKRILGSNKVTEDSDLSHTLDKIEANQEFIIKRQEKLEQLMTTILDIVEDAIIKPQATNLSASSPHNSRRAIADISITKPIHGEASTDPSSIADSAASEDVISKKKKTNAFDIIVQSQRKHQTYNATSIKGLTIEQVVKDYFEFHLESNINFSSSSNNGINHKTIHMIRTVVKFCLHYSQKSMENADEIISKVSAAAPDSNSIIYVPWSKARNTAAILISEHAMKEIDKIEKHVAKMLSKKAVIGASNTNKKAFVAGLYKRIGACSESGFFDKDNFTIKHSK